MSQTHVTEDGDDSRQSLDAPTAEVGLYPLQAKALSVIFDACRDYTQHEVLQFHPQHGLWSQIRDVRQKLFTDFYVAPESFWMYKVNAQSTATLTSLLVTNEVMYHKLKSVKKGEEVLMRFFCATPPDYPLPLLQCFPYDKKTWQRSKTIRYIPPASWQDIIATQHLNESVEHVPQGLYTHAIWVPSAELTHALNRIDLMDDSRVTIAIRGQCLILFASQHGYEGAHIHGKSAVAEEWLTPLEREQQQQQRTETQAATVVSPVATAIAKPKKRKRGEVTPEEEATSVTPVPLTNLPELSVVCSLKINFANKTANNSSDRVLVALSATHPDEGVLLYFPLRGMKGASFVRYRIASPITVSPYHYMYPPNYVPPNLYSCTLPAAL